MEQKVDVVTTLEVDMNVFLKTYKSSNSPKLHHEVYKKNFYIRNNELLMLKKQLKVI